MFCKEGRSVVIIDNTHVKVWEFKPYKQTAQRYGYIVFIIVPSAQFNTPAKVLAQRNKHDVDETTVARKLKVGNAIVMGFHYVAVETSKVLWCKAVSSTKHCLTLV